MKIKLTRSGIFCEAGDVLDMPPSQAQRLVRMNRAEFVPGKTPAPSTQERLIPRPAFRERMKKTT